MWQQIFSLIIWNALKMTFTVQTPLAPTMTIRTIVELVCLSRLMLSLLPRGYKLLDVAKSLLADAASFFSGVSNYNFSLLADISWKPPDRFEQPGILLASYMLIMTNFHLFQPHQCCGFLALSLCVLHTIVTDTFNNPESDATFRKQEKKKILMGVRLCGFIQHYCKINQYVMALHMVVPSCEVLVGVMSDGDNGQIEAKQLKTAVLNLLTDAQNVCKAPR
eukprot:Filipodium_phascolosomae@DN7445_c0_g1_i1.p1